MWMPWLFLQLGIRISPLTKAALLAGKDVYCAVPAADSIEELQELVDTVKTTGQIYMMGETSHYYPQAVYCRKRFAKGEFGKITYAEGEYLHDMDDFECSFYDVYKKSHGDDWKKYAGIPPMHYPTHSFGMILSVTGARVERLSCFGYDDSRHADQVFGKGRNVWDNPFSNETAVCKMSDGSVGRFNELRRVGISHTNHVRMKMYGERASFEEIADIGNDGYRGQTVWSERANYVENPDKLLSCLPSTHGANHFDLNLGIAPIHDGDLLPEIF